MKKLLKLLILFLLVSQCSLFFAIAEENLEKNIIDKIETSSSGEFTDNNDQKQVDNHMRNLLTQQDEKEEIIRTREAIHENKDRFNLMLNDSKNVKIGKKLDKNAILDKNYTPQFLYGWKAKWGVGTEFTTYGSMMLATNFELFYFPGLFTGSFVLDLGIDFKYNNAFYDRSFNFKSKFSEESGRLSEVLRVVPHIGVGFVIKQQHMLLFSFSLGYIRYKYDVHNSVYNVRETGKNDYVTVGLNIETIFYKRFFARFSWAVSFPSVKYSDGNGNVIEYDTRLQYNSETKKYDEVSGSSYVFHICSFGFGVYLF